MVRRCFAADGRNQQYLSEAANLGVWEITGLRVVFMNGVLENSAKYYQLARDLSLVIVLKPPARDLAL